MQEQRIYVEMRGKDHGQGDIRKGLIMKEMFGKGASGRAGKEIFE